MSLGPFFLLRFGLLTLLATYQAFGNPSNQSHQLKLLSRMRRSEDTYNRLIGGSPVPPGQFPSVARLYGYIPLRHWWGVPTSYTESYCGGTIIADNWVVSAAHCIKDADSPQGSQTPGYWKVKVGDVNLRTSWWSQIRYTLDKRVIKFIIHPKYNYRDRWKNDIVLVKTESLSVSSNKNADFAKMTSENLNNFPNPGTTCRFAGWGCTRKGGSLSATLRAAPFPAVSKSFCKQFFDIESDTRLCAGHINKVIGICQGDSGGPLLCLHGADWLFTGIASYLNDNDPANSISVFTRTSKYVDWIINTVSKN